MRGMDIRDELMRGHSRLNAERIADHVGADPGRFRELMRCVLKDSILAGQRAAYSMGIAVENHPELVVPYLKDLLVALDKPLHEAVHRNTLRILQFCVLPQKLHGPMAEKLFAVIHEPSRPIAVRAFAITAATRVVQLYPDLEHEFRLLLEEANRNDPGAAIRVRTREALKALSSPRKMR